MEIKYHNAPTYLGGPVIPILSHQLGLSLLDYNSGLSVRHETLKSIKSLGEWTELGWSHFCSGNAVLERSIAKAGSHLLLLDSHLSQDAVDGVQIQRHWAITAAHSHQIEHALGVEILFADSQRLHRDVFEGTIGSLQRSVKSKVGRRGQ